MVSASLPSSNATARPLLAVTAFGFIGPFIFLVSPVIAGQLVLQWQLLLPLLFNITGLAGLYGVLALGTLLAMATLGGLPDHWQTPPAALSSGRSGAAGLSLLAIFGYFTAVSGAWAFVGMTARAI